MLGALEPEKAHYPFQCANSSIQSYENATHSLHTQPSPPIPIKIQLSSAKLYENVTQLSSRQKGKGGDIKGKEYLQLSISL